MLSIIIPTHNEATILPKLFAHLKESALHPDCLEIIISDSGSTDKTRQIARNFGAIVLESNKKGRATQMNSGSKMATNDTLYFLHADSFPPKHFDQKIVDVVAKASRLRSGQAGTFTIKFDHPTLSFKFSHLMSHLPITAARFGDHSMFITKELFQKISGFRENMKILEDQEIFRRIKKHTKIKIINDPVKTSARRFLKNGIAKTHAIYYLINVLFNLRFPQKTLESIYSKTLTPRP